jgi:hypothetical protein
VFREAKRIEFHRALRDTSIFHLSFIIFHSARREVL